MESWTHNQPLFSAGLANLPSNTANPSGQTQADAVDTSYKIDVSNASISPNGSVVFIDTVAFADSVGVTTEPDYQNINPGLLMPINFLMRDIAIAYGIPLEINPPVAVQGTSPITFTAVIEPGVNIVSYEWVDTNTSQTIGTFQSILFDPIPTETTVIQLRVVDDTGAIGQSTATLLVNPMGPDLNGDGQSTIEDLYLMFPGWNAHEYSILDLLLINVGH